MRVLLLSESDYALATRKVAEELHCASVDCYLLASWEKKNHCQHYARARVRKRRLEANRLKRMISHA